MLICKPLFNVEILKCIVEYMDKIGLDHQRRFAKFQIPEKLDHFLWGFAPTENVIFFVNECLGDKKTHQFFHGCSQHLNFSFIDNANTLPSTSLASVLTYFFNTYSEYSNKGNYWLEEKEQSLWLVRSNREHLGISREKDFTEPMSLSVCVQVLKIALGNDWQPEKLEIIGGDVNKQQYLTNALFKNCNIAINQQHSAIKIGAMSAIDFLPLDIRTVNQPLTLQREIEKLMIGFLCDRHLNIDTIAESMGLSVRTLQRTLKSLNITFRQFLNETRMRYAAFLLNN
ncbi:MAG: hypothetical protein QNK26_07310 [Moritella sp.]|uniref:hypothetical protein n=1 Tax=Moritella sp. TaxID=78556 RepID=UPI0029AD3C8F|nr:hypothetical protein [Moritella sp.]MDX2320391.1 hypothetical protein [Moritella sp.]